MPFTDYFTFREKWDKIIPLDRVAEFQHDLDQLLIEDVLLMELQTELDQVIGEACKFAERLDALDKTSLVHWNDVREFLESPMLQAWRARQQS